MICLQSKEKSLSTRHRHSFQRIWRKQHQDNVNMCDEHLLNLCWIWFMLNIPQANMKLLLQCMCANYKYAAKSVKTYVGVRHLWIPNLQRCDKKSAAQNARQKVMLLWHCTKEKCPQYPKMRTKYTIVGRFILKSHIAKQGQELGLWEAHKGDIEPRVKYRLQGTFSCARLYTLYTTKI